MRKIFMVLFTLLISTCIFALTLADLDLDQQLYVKESLVSLNQEITFANVEELEGISYTLIMETEGYIIYQKDGKIYVVILDD